MNGLNFRYLYESYRLGSMRAAADKLGVAVSSISRQIAQLEAEAGVTMIEHGRRNIILTEAGELGMRYYQEQMSHSEAFEAQLADLKSLRSGRIKLALGEGFIGKGLTEVIAAFSRKHGGITLSVQMVVSSNEVTRMVAEDEAHLGLVYGPVEDPRIRVQVSVPQPLRVVMKHNHPLAGRESLKLADLGAYNLCLPEPSNRTRQLLRQGEAAEQITLEPSVTSNSINMIRDLLHSGQFITLFSVLAASKELSKGQFVAIPLDNPAFRESTSVSVIRRIGRRLPPGPSLLMTTLDAYLRGLPPLDKARHT
ncbi:LysR family transcriptional regulator [Stenotrophomonas sp. MMGLT7]|uniref:LysR family transcriptional regulator n=1 Tax=Stenotrophomonas sp. MMGLT7 TaxID=2901227 RepID=UPI001E39FBD9|nr:LysR family transcriptional regulator [Stenotrophomonas sp. MMGLT7]MCD7098797.1 LysR family transcriptional regulator [Stenotrophomonas sp. MMGLT7]